MSEPFNDAAFVSRLQKLLSMLGSEQREEAEAARRKLLEHLAHHRLSLSDVGAQLRPAPLRPPPLRSSPQRTPTPGFEDMSLERELHLARLARQEAEGDVARARQRVSELSQSLQEANVDASRAIAGQIRARLVAAIGWLLAGVAASVAVAQHLHLQGVADGQAQIVATQGALRRQSAAELDPVLRAGPGEQFGTVLVQDLAVRLTPSEDGGVRAFLNRGMRVVVQRETRVGMQNWLLIRSVTGTGWVRNGDVLH